MFMNGYTREDYFVASKLPPGVNNRQRAMQLIDESVQNVDAGYLDCMIVLLPITNWLKE